MLQMASKHMYWEKWLQCCISFFAARVEDGEVVTVLYFSGCFCCG